MPRLADSDVEEADIEALARQHRQSSPVRLMANVPLASRSKLRAGEFILGEEPKPTQAPVAATAVTACYYVRRCLPDRMNLQRCRLSPCFRRVRDFPCCGDLVVLGTSC